MSLRKRFAFPPLHANLYKLYKKGKVTNKSLGVITSSLKKIAPTVKQLLELIAFMSISKTDNGINIRDIINTDFVDVFDLIDTKEPDLTEVKIFEDYSCLPFCQLSPFTLLQRNQPFIFFSIDEYNLLLNYSHPNKFKIYSPSMKKDNIIDMVDLFMQFDIKDIINLKFAQATYIVADTSGSMLSSFNETGIHKGEIAIDAINKFGETSIQLKVLDPLIFKDNFIDLPLKYDEKMFDGKSPIWDKIHRAGTTMIELAKEIPKRIFIVTDGEDTLSKMEKDKVISFLRRNNIILDALILEEDLELTSDLRTICHLSGGASFTPSSIEEVNEFVTLESFIDLSQRTIHQINHIELENINKAQFENISKKIRCSKITSLHSRRTNFYKELILLSPYSQNDIKLSFRHKRINKEMNICINYLKYLIEKKKRPTFSFYYIYSQNNNEIDIGKWCVFIEKEVSDGRKLVFQVAVEFPSVYPMGIPKFRLLSNIQMNNVMSHGTINFDFEYKPNTRILELLFQIRDMLTLNGEFPERNELDEYDFIESIDEVESVFLFGNKKAGDEGIAFEMKNKYKELFKQ
ncbi:hypothetical protein TRFO_26329 [Tritrichomonas foetus]|uniref:UBC core domain-containing protein n=1 Tax=Tritrichomonas foetus TaxID=1144522 RepID=A0A1J4K307_9EUKA|nr:hypothetical protein TRFO_26329 [Tritrichomonas foetus]|eukprot:OHT05825.1 hypothetical protein TRFO_26329 [Tritrichomonas foetus]